MNNQNIDLKANKKFIEDQRIKLIQKDSMLNDLNKKVDDLNKNNEDLKKKLAIKNSIPSKGRMALSRGGNMPDISSVGVFKITFYTPYDGSSDGVTATGKKAIPGQTVAVDPRIIPLGTKLYIEDLGEVITTDTGYVTANDTGGAIHGNIIDFCVSSKDMAAQLGVKNLKVWIVR